MGEESNFTSFLCEKCGTEIEATLDMIGEATLCPACGANIVVPDNKDDGVVRHGSDDDREFNTGAMKSRTIRIELGDL